MLGTVFGLFRPYFNKPQRYAIEIAVHDIPEQSSLILPYPIHSDRQSTTEVTVQTDGHAIQHDGFYYVTDATHATVKATVNTQPYHLSRPLTGTILPLQILSDHYYLRTDQYVQPELPEIQRIAKELSKNQTSTYAILERLYQHTLERLTYGDPYAGLYSTQQALELPRVDCGGFDTYLAALARACGIPSRVVSGFWAGDGKNVMHAWLECLLPNDEWLPMDPSVEWLRQRGRTKKRGGFGDIGSDRVITSLGSHHVLHINNQEIPVGILQVPLLLNAANQPIYSTQHFITADRIA